MTTRRENDPSDQNRALIGFMLCLVALAIGFFALKLSPVSKIGPYGLIQALSPLYYVALILLIVSFAWNLNVKWHRSVLLGTHLAVLVFLIQGAPAVIEGAARFETAYLHVGFVGYIAKTGGLLQNLDARFSWPSFFEGVAMLDKVAGVNSAEVFLRWWPFVMNLLYLPLIFGIANEVLRSTPKAWIATAIFPLANWVGQDYFSPQSLAFLLYLAFVYVLIVPLGAHGRPAWQWLFERVSARREHRPNRRAPAPARQPRSRAIGFYLGVLVLLMVAIATSHQLTPIMAIVTTAVIVAAGRTRVRGMVLVVPLIAIGWICYGAVTFWSGHMGLILGGLGNIFGNAASGVTQRVSGNKAHEYDVDSRLLIAAVVWGLACLGALAWRSRNRDRTVVVLMFLSSFSMIAGGNYGGEGVLRIYLFSMPAAVCLIAALVSSLPRFWHGQLALGTTLVLLIPLFLVARWGNELYEMVRPGELTAANELYQMAPRGSKIVTIVPIVTLGFKDVGEFDMVSTDITSVGPRTLSTITATVAGDPKGGFVFITADEEKYGWMVRGMPENWGTTVRNMLAHSPHYKLRYANADGAIFQYIPHPLGNKL